MFEKELPCPLSDEYALREPVHWLDQAGPVFSTGTAKRGVDLTKIYPVMDSMHTTKGIGVQMIVNNEVFDTAVDYSGDGNLAPLMWEHRTYTGELNKPAGIRSKRYNSRFAPLMLAATLYAVGAGAADAFVLQDFVPGELQSFISENQHIGRQAYSGAKSIAEFRASLARSPKCDLDGFNYSSELPAPPPLREWGVLAEAPPGPDPFKDLGEAISHAFHYYGIPTDRKTVQDIAEDYYGKLPDQVSESGRFSVIALLIVAAFGLVVLMNATIYLIFSMAYLVDAFCNGYYRFVARILRSTYWCYLYVFQAKFRDLFRFRLRSRKYYIAVDPDPIEVEGTRIMPDRVIEMACPKSAFTPITSVDDPLIRSEIIFYVVENGGLPSKGKKWLDPTIMQMVSSGSVIKNRTKDGTIETLLSGSAHGTQHATHFSAKNSHKKFGVQRFEPLPTRLLRTPHAHDDDTDVAFWRADCGQLARASGLGYPTLIPAEMCCSDNNAWITPEGPGNILNITSIVDDKIFKSHGYALERITNNWNHGAHSATTVAGSSGAGLYISKDSKYYWAGIHLGARQALKTNYFALAEGLQPYLRDQLYDSDEIDTEYNPDGLMVTVKDTVDKVISDIQGTTRESKPGKGARMYSAGGWTKGDYKRARAERSRYIAGTDGSGHVSHETMRARLEAILRSALAPPTREGLGDGPQAEFPAMRDFFTALGSPPPPFSEFEAQLSGVETSLTAAEEALQAALLAPRPMKKKATEAQLQLEAERLQRARDEKAERARSLELDLAERKAEKLENQLKAAQAEVEAQQRRDEARKKAEAILEQRIATAKVKLEVSARDYFKRFVALKRIGTPSSGIEAEVLKASFRSEIELFIDILESEGGFNTKEKLATQFDENGWLASLLENETISPMLLEIVEKAPDYITKHDEPTVKHVGFPTPPQKPAGPRLAEPVKKLAPIQEKTEITQELVAQTIVKPTEPLPLREWEQPGSTYTAHTWAQANPDAILQHQQRMMMPNHGFYPGYPYGQPYMGFAPQGQQYPISSQMSGFANPNPVNTMEMAPTMNSSPQQPLDSPVKEDKQGLNGFGRGSPPTGQRSRQDITAPNSRRRQQNERSQRATPSVVSAETPTLRQPSKAQLNASAKLLGLQDTVGLSPELLHAISQVDTKHWKALGQASADSLKSGTHCFVNRLTAPPARGSPTTSSQEVKPTEVSSSATERQ